MDKKVIGIWYGGLAGLGVEIFDIEYGVDEKVVYRWVAGEKVSRVCRAKVRNDKNGRAYFLTQGHRVPLDECERL